MPKLPSHLCLHSSHLLFSSFVVPPETKKPSYFLTKMCFVTNHLVPFHTEPAGASLLAASLLLISVKRELFEDCSFGRLNKTEL